jgi:U32 family peptidase
MLKILAPFKEKTEVLPLIAAGANELYCGYLSPEWVKKYTSLEFERKGGRSNFTDLKNLKEAVDLAHAQGVPVFLTLNGLYVKEQYPLLLKILSQLKRIDLDGYIVADMGLLLTLRRQGYRGQIHISTGGTVFNSEAARFYKTLGASRIILDRQTSFGSMKTMARENPDLDFEVFILYTLCVYIDGFCTFTHTVGRETEETIPRRRGTQQEKYQLITTFDLGGEADACCLKYSVQAMNAQTRRRTSGVQPAFYKHLIDGTECGACAIYEISKTKVKALKIVGRQLDPQLRLLGTTFIRTILDNLKNHPRISKKDFLAETQKLYRAVYEYKGRCRGNNCYHPEVLLGGP